MRISFGTINSRGKEKEENPGSGDWKVRKPANQKGEYVIDLVPGTTRKVSATATVRGKNTGVFLRMSKPRKDGFQVNAYNAKGDQTDAGFSFIAIS